MKKFNFLVIAGFLLFSGGVPVCAQFGDMFDGLGKKESGEADVPDGIGDMFGGLGKSNSGDGSDGSMGGAFGGMMESAQNTNLGPVGRFVLGRKLAAMVLGRYKAAVPDDPRIPYLRDVIVTLLGNSRYFGNYKDPTVILLEEDEVINAFAAPGGFVFVTTGMLNLVKSEDELAFVLAHEIAHIELDHGLTAIISKEGQKIFTESTESMGIGSAFFDENGFSSELEAEADSRGAVIATNTGYDINAAVEAINRLEEVTGRKHATGYPANRANLIKQYITADSVLVDAVSVRTKRYEQAMVGGVEVKH